MLMSWMGARLGMGNAYHMVLDRNALGGVQAPPSEYPSQLSSPVLPSDTKG